jgi:hypothetical protein
MTAVNVVRFRVKPGMEEAFLDAHRNGKAAWPGLLRGFIVKTGDRAYTLVGEWPDIAAISAARPRMIGTLDSFRQTLEEQNDGKGLTDAVSGEVVLPLK